MRELSLQDIADEATGKKKPFSERFRAFVRRFTGFVYGPTIDFERAPERYGGKLGAHIEAMWTDPEHWAHDNYQRGHLPQLCIKASGWKARLFALVFRPKTPYIPCRLTEEARLALLQELAEARTDMKPS